MRTELTRNPMLLVVGILVALATGCHRASPPAAGPPAGPEDTRQKADAQPEEIPLAIAGWQSTEQLIAAQRGKVVVLDLWATW